MIGRKNWLFGGVKSSVAAYSLIQTAIENGLNPQAYLEYVFKQIQLQNDSCIEKLLPWAEEIPASCKMFDKKNKAFSHLMF